MKFLHILTLLLVALVAAAQRCPRSPSCRGARNIGRRGPLCRSSIAWYYDAPSRQCRRMRYLGCGGNSNRWCSQATCQQRCRR